MPAYENITGKPYVTHEHGATVASGTNTAGGLAANTYDQSNTTYYEAHIHHDGDGYAQGYVYSKHTWVDACTISKVRMVGYWDAFMGNYAASSYTFQILLCINGTWTVVHVSSGSEGASDAPVHNYDSGDISTGWEGVTGIEVRVNGYAYSYEGDRYQDLWLRVMEVYCYKIIKRSYSGVI